VKRRTRAALHMRSDVVNALSLHASNAMPNEAGGILIGLRTDDGIHIADVVNVPSGHPEHARYISREQDREAALQRHMSAEPYDSPFGYVGMWHSHPAPVGPSPRDRATFMCASRSAPDALALIVVAQAGDGNWELHARVGTRRSVREAQLVIVG
jgi:proteasome lid subunit RPN8/RPN11